MTRKNDDFIVFGGRNYYWNGVYYRLARQIKGLPVFLHVALWEYHNGKLPSGWVVHHRDENKRNNELHNLQAMPRSEHTRLHMSGDSEIKQKAAEWHRSEEGHVWHREQYAKTKDALHARTMEHTCDVCGKAYKSARKEKTNFCSKACKAKARRQSGVDDIDYVCKGCGAIFRHSKYIPRDFCSRGCSAKHVALTRKPRKKKDST